LLICACAASAANAAETGTIVETFTCKLRDGKTMADLDAATKYFNEQVDAAGALESYFAAQLVPIRANTEMDVIWIGADPNLNTWANEGDAWQAVPGGAQTQARFDEVVDCESGLFFSSDLYSALPDEDGDTATVIEAFGCTLNEGKTTADLAAAHQAYQTAAAALKAAGVGNFLTVTWTPYLANAPFDVAYLTVHDDMKAFAATNSVYWTSKEGAASEAEFGKVVKCKSGLYAGSLVREPAPAAE
jgi:hypothetical protein